MVIPKVSIGDLLNSSSNSTGAPSAAISHPTTPTRSSLVGNFINMLAKYADPVYNKVVNTAQDLGAGAIEPGREMINAAQGKPYQNPSPSAQRGLDMIQGGIMTSPSDVLAYQPDIPGIATQAKGAVNDVKNVVQETHANALAQPGGLQAGYIKPDAVVGNPAAQYPDGTILGPDGEPIVKPKAPEYGTKTAAQIKAEKARGLPPAVHSASDVPPTNAEFSYDNTPEGVIPANAEKIPPISGKPNQMGTDQVIAPEPMPKGPGRTIARVDLPASVYGAGNEAQVQATIDNFVPGETAAEQYKNLQPTLDNFGKQIKYQIQANPKTIDLHSMMNTYDTNLEEAGIYRTTTSSKGAVQQAAQKYVRSLANIGDDEGNITSQALADALKKVNSDAGPVFKKIDNGTRLLPQDEAILAARKTVRDTLMNMYGGEGGTLDQLLQKQGDLYDAAESLKKGRDLELKAAAKPSGMFNKIKNVGIGAAGAGIAAKELGLNPIPGIQTGLGFVEHGINNILHPNTKTNGSNGSGNGIDNGYDAQGNPNHGNSMTQFDTNVNTPADIPQSQDKIHQNPDGTYGIANIYSMKDPTDPSGNTSLFVSPENAKQQQLSIDKAKNTLLYKNSQQEQARVGQLQDQLNTQKEFSKQIQEPYATAQVKNSAYAQAIRDTKAAAPDIANFNGTYDQFIQQLDPKFADLKTQLQTLEKENAVNPNGIIKGATLLNALQTAAKGSLMNFYGQLNNITGFTGQGETSVQGTSTLPPTPQAIPQNFNIGGGNAPSLGGLPPLNNMPAQ